jgi:hypothetical protein
MSGHSHMWVITSVQLSNGMLPCLLATGYEKTLPPPPTGPVWYVQKVIPVQHCSTVFTSAVPSTDTNFLLLESLHKPGLYIVCQADSFQRRLSSGEEWVVKDGLRAVDFPTAFNSSRKGLQCNWLAVWIAIQLSIGEVVSLCSLQKWVSIYGTFEWNTQGDGHTHSACVCFGLAGTETKRVLSYLQSVWVWFFLQLQLYILYTFCTTTEGQLF